MYHLCNFKHKNTINYILMKRSENTQVAFQHEHSLSLLKMPNAEISRPHLNCDFLQETQVQSRGQEDPLEKGMALHREIPWTGVSGGLQSMELQRVKIGLSN